MYKSRIYIAILLCIGVSSFTLAQSSLSLQYITHSVLPSSSERLEKVGGFSAVAFDKAANQLVIVQDKPPATIVRLGIDPAGIPETDIKKVTILAPSPFQTMEMEGITMHDLTSSYFISDEQKTGTRILEFDDTGHFKRIILPVNKAFLPLSSHNSGIEGLTLSADGQTLFYAIERPCDSCFDDRITTLGRIDLASGINKTYAYQLHEVADDHLNTNGISELLWLGQDSLLVMERAYIPSQGNVVRLFEVSLQNTMPYQVPMIECNDKINSLVPAVLVFDFADVPGLTIDNAEGMCFNNDKSMLYIVTDNNFSNKQENQIITLQVQTADQNKGGGSTK